MAAVGSLRQDCSGGGVSQMNGFGELDTAARTVYGEARGEGLDGQRAVAWVIRNRVENPGWWGDSWESVCLKKWQFSCWLESDPNREKLQSVGYEDPDLRRCLRAVLEVMDSSDDPTQGSTHYLVSTLEPKPNWYSDDKVICRIGHHAFLKDV